MNRRGFLRGVAASIVGASIAPTISQGDSRRQATEPHALTGPRQADRPALGAHVGGTGGGCGNHITVLIDIHGGITTLDNRLGGDAT